MVTCQTCAHCDTDEARPAEQIAGFCTLPGGFFNGRQVPTWCVCPWHQPVTSAQVDGDGGEA